MAASWPGSLPKMKCHMPSVCRVVLWAYFNLSKGASCVVSPVRGVRLEVGTTILGPTRFLCYLLLVSF